MRPNLDPTIQQLHLLQVLIKKEDKTLSRFLTKALPDMEPFFAISWVLTWSEALLL
jgi:hypothetical protein